MSAEIVRILFVEDREEDAELAAWTLRKEGLSAETLRVETEEEFLAALEGFRPDVVVSDYAMPCFDGLRALELCLDHEHDIPFVVLTGSMDEETAVACLKAGATDYVLKEQMGRLPFAVREALARRRALGDKSQAEAALRESEERWRSLVESVPDGMVVQSDGIVRFANQAMARLVGVADPGELVGTSVLDLVAPEDREAARARIVAYADVDEPGPPVEEHCLRRDGSKVAVEAMDVHYPHGGSNARLVFIRDRSERESGENERRALEEQLQHAQKMESVGMLAGGVAHDFNNILMVQKGYCELMRSDLNLDPQVLDGLAQIEACADRATALTRQLLAFSRKQVLQPTVLDVNGLIEDMEDMLKRVVGEGVELSLSLPSKKALVKADPMQLEQVFVNLAANARDAMPEGGALRIEVSAVDLGPDSQQCRLGAAAGPSIMIAVTDNGTGMDSETRKRIFEPFYTTKGEGKGTGLGLSTVYGVVQQSGGSVFVESEPERGTTFRLFLPRVHDRLQEDAPEGAAVPGGDGQLIVIVEDEPVLRGLVRLMVESLGYVARVAANGAEAKSMILEEGVRPDLLLSDVVMPGMSGAALVEELRRVLPDLKFVFMSGYPDTAIARHRIPNAAFDFLQKPFSIRDLANKIETVLGPTGVAGNRPEG